METTKMRLVLLFHSLFCAIFFFSDAQQVIEVVELPESASRSEVYFEFLKPRGFKVSIRGPYPNAYQFRLKFNLNVNKKLDGLRDWMGTVIVPRGRLWSYTFPEIRVKQGDTIHYRIEAEWRDSSKFNIIKGYKGTFDVTQSSPHGLLLPDDPSPDKGDFPDPAPLKCRRGQGQDSRTTYSGGQVACKGELLVPSYMRVSPEYWRPGAAFFMKSVKQIGGLGPEDRFTIFTKENIFLNATHAAFVPMLLTDKYGPSAVDSNFTIKGCTSSVPELCSSAARGYLILPPILSGRHSSQDSFSFRYGTVEVSAKMPSGDWIVSELWLVAKDREYGNSSGRIVLAKSRGNAELSDEDKDYSSRVLEAGVEFGNNSRMFRKVQTTAWSQDYHKFKLVWTPEKMEFYVDGVEIGRIEPEEKLDPDLSGPNIAPFDKEFYLVFGVHVGGAKDFPDSLNSKPWMNSDPKDKLNFWRSRQSWHKTWSTNSALIIKSLTVTAMN